MWSEHNVWPKGIAGDENADRRGHRSPLRCRGLGDRRADRTHTLFATLGDRGYGGTRSEVDMPPSSRFKTSAWTSRENSDWAAADRSNLASVSPAPISSAYTSKSCTRRGSKPDDAAPETPRRPLSRRGQCATCRRRLRPIVKANPGLHPVRDGRRGIGYAALHRSSRASWAVRRRRLLTVHAFFVSDGSVA